MNVLQSFQQHLLSTDVTTATTGLPLSRYLRMFQPAAKIPRSGRKNLIPFEDPLLLMWEWLHHHRWRRFLLQQLYSLLLFLNIVSYHRRRWRPLRPWFRIQLLLMSSGAAGQPTHRLPQLQQVPSMNLCFCCSFAPFSSTRPASNIPFISPLITTWLRNFCCLFQMHSMIASSLPILLSTSSFEILSTHNILLFFFLHQ